MIRLILPYEVPSQNVTMRTHWRSLNSQNKRLLHQIMVCVLSQAHPVADGPRTVRVMAYRVQRIKDHANLIGGAKGLIDCLKRARLIVDDCDSLMVATYEQRVCSHPGNPNPGRPCTVVEIEPKSCCLDAAKSAPKEAT